MCIRGQRSLLERAGSRGRSQSSGTVPRWKLEATYRATQYCIHESVKKSMGIAVQGAREAGHMGMLAMEAACWQLWRDSLGSLRA